MTNAEKAKRIKQAMLETHDQLVKARKRYNDTIKCLKMEIAENKKLGNDLSANKAWVDYANQDKARVRELEAHMQRLEKMLKDIA